jgi:GC-rich sequence DNA-binding factor
LQYPSLERIEDDHTSLLRERLDFVSQRRRQDDEDDLSSVYGALPPPAEDPKAEPAVDDLGRTIPEASQPLLKRERRAARDARRHRRLSRTAPEADEEGYSTDSSLPPADASDYTTALSSLKTRTKEILADVRAEEFKNPSSTRWNAWRDKYGESYRNAWGGLGIISVWEFWVRLETATWDCIEVIFLSFPVRAKPNPNSLRIREVLIASNGIKGSTTTRGLPPETRQRNQSLDPMATWSRL